MIFAEIACGQRPRSHTVHVAQVDKVVEVQGLQSAAQYNGERGLVILYDTERGRYKVRLFGAGGTEILIKHGNLIFLQKKS